MLTVLTFSVLAVVGFALAGVLAIPFLVIGAAFWLLLLPFKLLGCVLGGVFGLLGAVLRLVFGLLGGLLGLLFAPLVLVLLALGLIGWLIGSVFALVTPLVPVVLVLLVGWAIYQLAIRPSAPI